MPKTWCLWPHITPHIKTLLQHVCNIKCSLYNLLSFCSWTHFSKTRFSIATFATKVTNYGSTLGVKFSKNLQNFFLKNRWACRGSRVLQVVQVWKIFIDAFLSSEASKLHFLRFLGLCKSRNLWIWNFCFSHKCSPICCLLDEIITMFHAPSEFFFRRPLFVTTFWPESNTWHGAGVWRVVGDYAAVWSAGARLKHKETALNAMCY